MNYYLNSITISVGLFLTFVFWQGITADSSEATTFPEFSTTKKSTQNNKSQDFVVSCGPSCVPSDSLALLAFRNAANGNSWMASAEWHTWEPVCEWFGVTLDADGYVVGVDLTSKNLSGYLHPDIGNLSRLELFRIGSNNVSGNIPASLGNCTELYNLQIDNNNFTGSIPTSFGNLTKMEVMFIDDNKLGGTIPTALGNLTFLRTFFMDNNMITGTVPNSMTSLMSLNNFQLYNNQIDSLPDFSGIPNWLDDKFRFQDNQLTFDDVLPNIGDAVMDNYEPQDSVFAGGNVNVIAGSSYTIDLDIDDAITSNHYAWYFNGSFLTTTSVNQLTIDPIDYSNQGCYTCRITNPNAPLLTLHSRKLCIDVYCGPLTGDVDVTLCNGSDIIIEGVTFNIGHPSELILLSENNQYGCDSLINVNVDFIEVDTTFIDTILCGSQTIEINDTIYNSTTSGITIVEDGYGPGCDSIIAYDITKTTLSTQLLGPYCPDTSFTLNGNTYDINNTFGFETIPSASGCDSTILLLLTFYPEAEGNFFPQVCGNQTVDVHGTIFSATDPTGDVVLENAAANGCDSTIHVFVQETTANSSVYNPRVCLDDTVTVGTQQFYFGNDSGPVTLTMGSANGCDSVINVDVDFFPEASSTLNAFICPDSIIVIDGQTFNGTDPIVLEDQSFRGCDSIITINVTYYDIPTSNFSAQICTGGHIEINGEIFSASHLTSTQTIPNASQYGCDSIVVVTVSESGFLEANYTQAICPDETITINGEDFNAGHLSSDQDLGAVGQNGCDSLLHVVITVLEEAKGTYITAICTGDQVEINGEIFNASHLNNTQRLDDLASNGCDSLVDVTVTLLEEPMSNYTPSLCKGSSVSVGDPIVVIFDESYSSGPAIIENGGANGCDSIVNVNLFFYPTDTTYYTPQFCSGGEEVIGNGTYNEANPSGEETLTSTLTGCDSVVVIAITFGDAIIIDYTPTLCFGDSVEVQSIWYTAMKPSGQATYTMPSGCDSIVNIDISFYPEPLGSYKETLCNEDTVMVGTGIYHKNKTYGYETLPGQAQGGCDSIVEVDLTFRAKVQSNFTATFCPGQTITINNVVYGPGILQSGQEILQDSSYLGCDSTVIINISEGSANTTTITGPFCPDYEIVAGNGNVYNIDNPMGKDTFAIGTCDSIVNINLLFYQTESNFIKTFCEDTIIVIGNMTFNQDNTDGVVTIENGTVNGCDSIVNVDLTFGNSTTIIDGFFCADTSFVVNGNTYDIDTPQGTEILPSSADCDSTITFDLNFYPSIPGDYAGYLCEGDSIEINNNWYHKDKLTGTEIFEGLGQGGCDSTLIVTLTPAFHTTGILQASYCANDEIIINGTAYNINHPSGEEILEGANAQGCDSIVTIDLTFDQITAAVIDTTICAGTSLIIGDQAFSEAGQYNAISISRPSADCDSLVDLTLAIEDPFEFGFAEAGADADACDVFDEIGATLGAGQIGFWSSMGIGIVDHIDKEVTGVSNLQPGPNTFVWSVSTDACLNYDSDTMVMTYYPMPEPEMDNFEMEFGLDVFDLNLLENDYFHPEVETPITITTTIDTGGTILQEVPSLLQFVPQLGFEGMASGTYTICGTLCPELCEETPFQIMINNRIGEDTDEWFFPSGITPNGDGSNDAFVIDPLLENPNEYPQNEMVIFNRWGNVVYRQQPYQNDWRGTNQSGQALPEGTYYYVFRLNLAHADVYKGDVTIIR